MNLLVIDSVSKTYGEKALMQNISLGIDEGEKIGVLGINGSGKSTLLKIIAGQDEPDLGTITRNKSLRCSYLAQNPVYNPEAGVMDMVLNGSTPSLQAWENYRAGIRELENSAVAPDELIRLSEQLDMQEAWKWESEAQTILTRLGINEFETLMKHLSGGQRKRIALAAALLDPGNLLVLDEPTNHLDNLAIEWLEKYLQRFAGTLIMVTHDRYFLERVCSRILELDRGQLYSYPGNYDVYLARKLEREEKETVAATKRKTLLAKELAWIRRGAQARSTKQKARIQRFEKLQADQHPNQIESLHLSSAASRLGKKTIILQNIEHSYQSGKIIADYSHVLDRQERLGIVGPNGIGKSTLLGIMNGSITPAKGTVEIGATVKIGYFPQESRELPEDMKVIDYIREAGEYISDGHKLISAAQMLETFLFPPAAQWTPLARLSGGEKRRLHLLRILMTAPNVLLLDEPDNDLDIETLTLLEDYLDNFEGAVVAISHDRYFLDRICSNILAFAGKGVLVEFPGNYTDYLSQSVPRDPDQSAAPSSIPAPPTKPRREAAARPLKFSFKEQKEFAEIDDDIAGAEAELKALDAKIDQAAQDYQQLQILLESRKEIEQRLDHLLERWTYLNELAELMARS
ncbi:MAG: ABC-F family ATP-binding cassette domain-containing protein [Syntrophomonadaceae bacterium]|nr:ABC-F family ATP-binding cassette domain-containing protein [Syntrophomonadaceae bacterium]